MSDTSVTSSLTVDSFIDRWSGREGGQERANYGMFLSELCDVIGVERPDPAGASHESNDYVFERSVRSSPFDGQAERGRIDLYKRGCFILEAKQSRLKGAKKEIAGQGDLFKQETKQALALSGSWDVAMTNARRQAESYARKLPNDHPYPPFILTCDVGRYLEVFADFSETGRHYSPFPGANSHKIWLEDLQNEGVRQRLRSIWSDPQSLDPAKQSAKVTREIAGQLAVVSKALEERGFDPGEVAMFLMRCLFTMFVEDVGLIKDGSFAETLERCAEEPKRFPLDMEHLWKAMDQGGYSPLVGEWLLRFNGKLFKHARAFPLNKSEIELLQKAALSDWRDLEPAIFGSLFEQALDPEERKRLGAHYTPRTYVERLVNATIIEPLEENWISAQASAQRALDAGSNAAAVGEIVGFLKKLSQVRVLDPACGTGNFLYVALAQMKRLEGDVVNLLRDLGGDSAALKTRDVSVLPEQFLGMEVNPRAVQIAELVLWIGYLQWHLKTRTGPPPEPVIDDSDHVLEKDAVLTWDGYPERILKRDATGKPLTKMDGNGNRIEQYVLPNPTQPHWPEADFIVGNPPFIGGKDIRSRLREDYATALWKAHPKMNKSADFVMYWWDRAARQLVAKNTRLRRFGLVTTNSITQVFQRRVVERHLRSNRPISLLLAIPDHPWTKSTREAAAVRIAMTVASAGKHDGVLKQVTEEARLGTDKPEIVTVSTSGQINSDLTVGTDVTAALSLAANSVLSSPGVKLHGDGFIISPDKAAELGLGTRPGLERHIRDYRNGRDLTARSRGVQVIDLFGLPERDVRTRFPEVYQHLIREVKEKRDDAGRLIGRDGNNRKTYRENWWVFGEPRSELRPALQNLPRYIVTVETMKHRVFQFLDNSVLPDNMLVAIASSDAYHLGVLSSRLHVAWALHAGGRQGVGNDPRYNKSRCFDPFPFPDTTETIRSDIRELAEELDTTRKRVLSENGDLTLTKLYNVLDKLRTGDNDAPELTEDHVAIRDRGQVLILKELHDSIDTLVCEAYGWQSDVSDQDVLSRLVALNAERTAEERRGFIRWLRPDFQIERLGPLSHKADRVQAISVAHKEKKRPFPKDNSEQSAHVLQFIRNANAPIAPDEIAAEYSKAEKVVGNVREILVAMNRLGFVRTYDNGKKYVGADL